MAGTESSLENVRNIAEFCEILVKDTVHGRQSMAAFTEVLQGTGISAEAAEDYVQEVQQRLAKQLGNSQPTSGTSSSFVPNVQPKLPATGGGSARPDVDSRPPSGSSATAGTNTSPVPVGPAHAREARNPPTSVDVNEEVTWALLQSKFGVSRPEPKSGSTSMDAPFVELLKAIGTTSASNSSVPQCLQLLPTWLNSIKPTHLMIIYTKIGNYVKPLALKGLLSPLLTLCSVS